MSGIMSMLLGAVSSAAAAVDEFFNRVTLLLPGNGTNGAQNNTFLDSSTNNFTITRNGNTTQGTFSPFSQTGWSNFFDGTDDYIAVADNAVLRPGTSNFTLEAWVWRNASGAAHTIYAKGGASTGIVFQVTSTNVLRFTHTTTNIDSTGTIAANAWTHVAVVREGTGTNQTKLYINGTQDGQGTVSTDFTQTEEVRIGTDRSAAADFNGYISNLRFVKGTALYTTTFTPSTTPLTTTSQGATATEVELLTCQSNRFLDNSSNEFAITLTGTPSVQAFEPFAPGVEYSAATVGGSGYFDGTGDYLSVATNAALTVTGNVDACFEAWIYPAATPGGTATILQKSGISGSVYANYELGFSSSRLLVLFGGNSGSPGSAVFTLNGATALPLNAWSHVVGTKRYVGGGSVNEYRVFVNGKLDGYATAANISDGNAQAFTVASQPSGTAFTGYISGGRVFNTSIPASYQTTNTTVGTQIFTSPTAPATAGTASILCNFTNAGITDATAKNVLETVGNAQISTTQSKFGGSSMYFDGTGDYLVSPNIYVGDFLTGDFTIEYWFRCGTQGTSYVTQVGTLDSGSGANSWRFGTHLNTTAGVYFSYHNGSGFVDVTFTTTNYNDNAWHHAALTRSGSTVRAFIDGTQVGSNQTISTSFSARRVVVGAELSTPTYYTGYIDDLRITKGYARYTSNFTAPTSAFALQ